MRKSSIHLQVPDLFLIFLTGLIFLSLVIWNRSLSVHAQVNESPSSQTENCTFTGVVDLQGRTDDSGATFTAGDFSAVTDSSGYYEIAVPGDTYTVTAEMNRYLDSERIDENCLAGVKVQLPEIILLGGDANDDCLVNILDLSFMGARFRLSSGDPNFEAKADINADGVINIFDITLAGANFLKECPVLWEGSALRTTPEPYP